jgi:hypothetical protein
MLFKKVPMIDGLEIDQAHKGGGKGAPPPPPPPQVAPTPPVEEAAVKLEENDEKDMKKRRGKESLKLPLANTSSVGLAINKIKSKGL